MMLFHGGAPGRAVGDLLLPPFVTGAVSWRDRGEGRDLGPVVQRHDRVYVTSERSLARACAGVWNSPTGEVGGGVLYQVEVDDELEPDPDLPLDPPVSFQISQARVVRIIDAYVARNDRRHSATLNRYLSRL
jgi:hypothetical protein